MNAKRTEARYVSSPPLSRPGGTATRRCATRPQVRAHCRKGVHYGTNMTRSGETLKQGCFANQLEWVAHLLRKYAKQDHSAVPGAAHGRLFALGRPRTLAGSLNHYVPGAGDGAQSAGRGYARSS